MKNHLIWYILNGVSKWCVAVVWRPCNDSQIDVYNIKSYVIVPQGVGLQLSEDMKINDSAFLLS